MPVLDYASGRVRTITAQCIQTDDAGDMDGRHLRRRMRTAVFIQADPIRPRVTRSGLRLNRVSGRLVANAIRGGWWQCSGTGSARECDRPCCRKADPTLWSDLIRHHHVTSLVPGLIAGKAMRSVNSFVSPALSNTTTT